MSTKTEQEIKENGDIEINEWLDSLDYVIKYSGGDRAKTILSRLQDHAFQKGLRVAFTMTTPYINTISYKEQPTYPGNLALERRIRNIIRWNAMAMVVRANKKDGSLGGHISTYASCATLLEVGFNHFFKSAKADYGGDLIFFQGHSSPGIYARAFVEGRLSEEQLDNFRRELSGGLPSYPHPRLMPNFWQFPTTSMGLSPIMAIYQARFAKYLENRGLKPKNGGKIWSFIGDGETDEPETLGAINLATREKLDNLIFVVNCNLQRLDGPVRGNGKIIQELEGTFRGAGWNVIKLIWGNKWDPLLESECSHVLIQRMAEVVDGEYQKYSVESGNYIRQHFFGQYPELLDLVKHIPDDELRVLNRGGHDTVKVYAAFKKATENQKFPTVILAQTVKGYGLGAGGEAQNISHQQKKLNPEEIKHFRNRFNLPISDENIEELPFFRPEPDSKEAIYIRERREKLGGFFPERKFPKSSLTFNKSLYKEFLQGSQGRELSTTMAFVRLLSKLLKDENCGKYVVPIVPDEARTFGMESLFRQTGIYSVQGQLYEPVDRSSLLYYKESKEGQILEEGITEDGAMSSFIAAGTSYANHGIPTIPFYIFYSMFGFQRMADLAWAAGDLMCKGFLLGATAGRTTLNGEGLQHQDGQSHLYASMIPNIKSYEPAFAYEVSLIIQEGVQKMYRDNEDCFYYITLQNENYPMPPIPEGVEEGIIRGMYCFQRSSKKGKKVHLLSSGSIMNCALKAHKILEEKYGCSVDVWSVTSYTELRRDGLDTDRENLLNVQKKPKLSYIQQLFSQEEGVVVASSDFMKIIPDGIRQWIPLSMIALGTDGFGLSETRELLREHFEIDENFIILAAIKQLFENKQVDKNFLNKAVKDLQINTKKINPMNK